MHGALTLKRGVERSWQAPLAIDSLLNYNMLGGFFFCLFVSLTCFTCGWMDKEDLLTTKPRFPFVRASDSEIRSALATPKSGVIEVLEDNSVSLDGRTVGSRYDAKLRQLTSAIWTRAEDGSATAPVVICVSPKVQHARVVSVLNALERANMRDYVLLFEGQSQDEPVWKGRR